MTTLEDKSDDETVSISDEDYEERHRGICESCHEIGIIGTACSKCDTHGWAQVVAISVGWREYLDKRKYEANLGNNDGNENKRSRTMHWL
jgi:hypothetical protein